LFDKVCQAPNHQQKHNNQGSISANDIVFMTYKNNDQQNETGNDEASISVHKAR
jgi:hypothetical protein